MRVSVLFIIIICFACKREKQIYQPKDFYSKELPKAILRNDKEIFGTIEDWYKFFGFADYEFKLSTLQIKYDISAYNDYYFLQPYILIDKDIALQYYNQNGTFNFNYASLSERKIYNLDNSEVIRFEEMSKIIIDYEQIKTSTEKQIKLYFLDQQKKKLEIKKGFYKFTIGPQGPNFIDVDFTKVY